MNVSPSEALCVMLSDGRPDPDQRCPGCNAPVSGEIRVYDNGNDPTGYEVMFECMSYFMTDLADPRWEEGDTCADRWHASRQRLEDTLTQLRAAITAAEAEGPEQNMPGTQALEAFYTQLLEAERAQNPGFWPDSVRQTPEDAQPLAAMCCQNTSKACMVNGPCSIWTNRTPEDFS